MATLYWDCKPVTTPQGSQTEAAQELATWLQNVEPDETELLQAFILQNTSAMYEGWAVFHLLRPPVEPKTVQ